MRSSLLRKNSPLRIRLQFMNELLLILYGCNFVRISVMPPTRQGKTIGPLAEHTIISEHCLQYSEMLTSFFLAIVYEACVR